MEEKEKIELSAFQGEEYPWEQTKYSLLTAYSENQHAETDAQSKYFNFLRLINASKIKKSQKDEIAEILAEVIEDELNHQTVKLPKILEILTCLEPYED